MATWAYQLSLQPKDKDGGTDPAAIPVTRILGASIRYGKTTQSTSYSAGTMTLELDNTDGALTPGGGSTYSNARFVGVACDLFTTVTGESPDLTDYTPRFFSGVIVEVRVDLSDRFQSRMYLTVTDALGQLGSYFNTVYYYDPATNVQGDVVAFADADAGSDGLMPYVIDNLVTATNFTSTYYLIDGGSAAQNVWARQEFMNVGEYLRRSIDAEVGDFFVRHGLPILRSAAGKRNLLVYRPRLGTSITDEPTAKDLSHVEELAAYDTRIGSPPANARPFSSADFDIGSSYGYTRANFTMEDTFDASAVTLFSGTLAYNALGRKAIVDLGADYEDGGMLFLSVTAYTLNKPVQITVEDNSLLADPTDYYRFPKTFGTETVNYVATQTLRRYVTINLTADSGIASGNITLSVKVKKRTAGVAQEISASTAIVNEYGVTSIQRTGMFTVSNAATADTATETLDRYGPALQEPIVLRSLKFPPVMPGTNDGWEMAKFSTGDKVNAAIQNAGNTLRFGGMIVGVGWDITPTSGARLTVFCEDISLISPLILDDLNLGTLGNNRLG